MSESSEPTIDSWVQESFSDEAAQAALDLLPEGAAFYRRYGGFALRRGDYDASWPSRPAPGEREIGLANEDLILPGLVIDPAEERPPTISLGGHVARLQSDLQVLGFRMVREIDGVFGPRTEQAVREFQVYAGMGRVAEEDPEADGEYVERLSGTDNPEGSMTRYTGEVTGVLNQETRRCLTHWINEGYRCPVVITARTGDGYASVYDGDAMADGADPENLWGDDDLQDTTPRVFAYDFTDYYDLGGTGHEDDERLVVGQAQSYTDAEGHTWHGQVTKEQWNHVWDVAEVSMDTFGLGPEEQSTFEIIDAVAEIECQGYLDGMNAYDPACLSAGPYHWTLALFGTNNQIGEGELGAFLSYLRSQNPEAYQQVFRRFGVDVDPDWGENGEALFSHTHKYTASINRKVGRSQGDAEMAAMPMGAAEDMSKEEAIQEWRYFRNWHWYYRFLMAARTSEAFRQACWDFARLRLEDILTVEWDDPPESWEEGTTIGDIFTSQKARTMILRWHVYSPAQIISYGAQGDQLENAFENAQTLEIDNPQAPQLDFRPCEQDTPDSELNWHQAPNWNQDPGAWDDRHECQLIRGIFQAAYDVGGENNQININENIKKIYTDKIRTLSEYRKTY